MSIHTELYSLPLLSPLPRGVSLPRDPIPSKYLCPRSILYSAILDRSIPRHGSVGGSTVPTLVIDFDDWDQRT
jgi:hypothetical protein